MTTRLIHVTYPTKMRQYLIISWIYFILSVINFALAAPLVIRERPEVRVDVVGVAKDRTAASQTLSRSWDPRDEWSGSNRRDAPPGQESESSGESDPEARPNSPSTETESEEESGSGSEAGSNDYNSASSSASSTGSPHAYTPPAWGGGMASHDAIADGGQLLLPPSPPNGRDHASMPQWSSDDPPSQTLGPSDSSSSSGLAVEGLLQLHPSYPSGPESTGLESIGSEPTSSKSTGSGSTSSGSTSSDSASSGSTGSDDPAYGTGTFIRKLLNGKIEARTSPPYCKCSPERYS